MKSNILVQNVDITTLEIDAIVNAANKYLIPGGGVDGAIHKAAGPKLYDECKKIGACPTGEAVLTKGYALPVKYIIHTVGPIWKGGNSNEVFLLKSCYINTLNLAKEKGIKTIAFPNISTGVYGFPKQKAAKIAIETVNDFISENLLFSEIIFACFDKENFDIYTKLLETY